jgi:hypothetical protein
MPAAVLRAPQLCKASTCATWSTSKQGSERLSPLNAKSLTHNFAFALLYWLARRWTEDRACVEMGEATRSQAPSCDQMPSLQAQQPDSERTSFHGSVARTLRAVAQQPAALAGRPPGLKLMFITALNSLCGDGAERCLERSARA